MLVVLPPYHKARTRSKEDLIHFLQRLNPMMMRDFKKQYKAKYNDFEIIDFGLKVEIKKIAKKDKWFNKTLRDYI